MGLVKHPGACDAAGSSVEGNWVEPLRADVLSGAYAPGRWALASLGRRRARWAGEAVGTAALVVSLVVLDFRVLSPLGTHWLGNLTRILVLLAVPLGHLAAAFVRVSEAVRGHAGPPGRGLAALAAALVGGVVWGPWDLGREVRRRRGAGVGWVRRFPSRFSLVACAGGAGLRLGAAWFLWQFGMAAVQYRWLRSLGLDYWTVLTGVTFVSVAAWIAWLQLEATALAYTYFAVQARELGEAAGEDWLTSSAGRGPPRLAAAERSGKASSAPTERETLGEKIQEPTDADL